MAGPRQGVVPGAGGNGAITRGHDFLDGFGRGGAAMLALLRSRGYPVKADHGTANAGPAIGGNGGLVRTLPARVLPSGHLPLEIALEPWQTGHNVFGMEQLDPSNGGAGVVPVGNRRCTGATVPALRAVGAPAGPTTDTP